MCVNGKKVQTPDGWVDPDRDKVTFDGKPLKAARKIYLLLYKPKGYLTTFKDPEGRPTVYDLLKPNEGDRPLCPLPLSTGNELDTGGDREVCPLRLEQWVFPVGRLDQDTSGLLLLTNDSEFGDYVSSPASHVPKTYLVKASRLLTEAELDQLRHGLQLADGRTRPALVERVRDSEKYSFFEITLTEGRNRQVRRMVEALQAKVLKLVRVRIADIRIGDLQIGTARPLTDEELKSLSKDRLLTRAVRNGAAPVRKRSKKSRKPR